MRPWACTLTALTAALCGCANPILRIEGPGYSAEYSKPTSAEPQSMAEAHQKLNHVRAKYYEAIVDQAQKSQDATSGLVWLGAAIAGMAAGNVHRSTILGASLIGGTTYGLSRIQLDGRRIQVWLEGIKGLDCAKEASLPLDIGSARRELLDRSASALSARREGVQSARAKVQLELDKLARTPSDATRSGQDATAKADTALADADKTLVAASDLLRMSRGGEVSVAVDRVSNGVTAAMTDLLIDPSSIKQLVASSGDFAAIFAPGAGIDTTLGGAFAKFSTAKATLGAQASVLDGLDNAMAELASEMQGLAAAQAQVKGLLAGVSAAAISDALKKCGVIDSVVAPLTIEPATLNFDAQGAATKGFEIKGGKQPYTVGPLDALPDGLAVLFKGGFEDTAQIKVTATTPVGDYRVLVSDAGNPKRSQQLVVHVAPAASAAAAVAEAAAAPAATATSASAQTVTVAAAAGGTGAGMAAATVAAWNTLIAALKKPDFRKELKGVKFSVDKAERVGKRLQVRLSCDPADAGLPVKDVRELLATADKAAVKQLVAAKALDGDFTQIDLASSLPCVKP